MSLRACLVRALDYISPLAHQRLPDVRTQEDRRFQRMPIDIEQVSGTTGRTNA